MDQLPRDKETKLHPWIKWPFKAQYEEVVLSSSSSSLSLPFRPCITRRPPERSVLRRSQSSREREEKKKKKKSVAINHDADERIESSGAA